MSRTAEQIREDEKKWGLISSKLPSSDVINWSEVFNLPEFEFHPDEVEVWFEGDKFSEEMKTVGEMKAVREMKAVSLPKARITITHNKTSNSYTLHVHYPRPTPSQLSKTQTCIVQLEPKKPAVASSSLLQIPIPASSSESKEKKSFPTYHFTPPTFQVFCHDPATAKSKYDVPVYNLKSSDVKTQLVNAIPPKELLEVECTDIKRIITPCPIVFRLILTKRELIEPNPKAEMRGLTLARRENPDQEFATSHLNVTNTRMGKFSRIFPWNWWQNDYSRSRLGIVSYSYRMNSTKLREQKNTSTVQCQDLLRKESFIKDAFTAYGVEEDKLFPNTLYLAALQEIIVSEAGHVFQCVTVNGDDILRAQSTMKAALYEYCGGIAQIRPFPPANDPELEVIFTRLFLEHHTHYLLQLSPSQLNSLENTLPARVYVNVIDALKTQDQVSYAEFYAANANVNPLSKNVVDITSKDIFQQIEASISIYTLLKKKTSKEVVPYDTAKIALRAAEKLPLVLIGILDIPNSHSARNKWYSPLWFHVIFHSEVLEQLLQIFEQEPQDPTVQAVATKLLNKIDGNPDEYNLIPQKGESLVLHLRMTLFIFGFSTDIDALKQLGKTCIHSVTGEEKAPFPQPQYLFEAFKSRTSLNDHFKRTALFENLGFQRIYFFVVELVSSGQKEEALGLFTLVMEASKKGKIAIGLRKFTISHLFLALNTFKESRPPIIYYGVPLAEWLAVFVQHHPQDKRDKLQELLFSYPHLLKEHQDLVCLIAHEFLPNSHELNSFISITKKVAAIPLVSDSTTEGELPLNYVQHIKHEDGTEVVRICMQGRADQDRTLYAPLPDLARFTPAVVMKILRDAIQQFDHDHLVKGQGSTLTFQLFLPPGHMIFCNVGDSIARLSQSDGKFIIPREYKRHEISQEQERLVRQGYLRPTADTPFRLPGPGPMDPGINMARNLGSTNYRLDGVSACPDLSLLTLPKAATFKGCVYTDGGQCTSERDHLAFPKTTLLSMTKRMVARSYETYTAHSKDDISTVFFSIPPGSTCPRLFGVADGNGGDFVSHELSQRFCPEYIPKAIRDYEEQEAHLAAIPIEHQPSCHALLDLCELFSQRHVENQVSLFFRQRLRFYLRETMSLVTPDWRDFGKNVEELVTSIQLIHTLYEEISSMWQAPSPVITHEVLKPCIKKIYWNVNKCIHAVETNSMSIEELNRYITGEIGRVISHKAPSYSSPVPLRTGSSSSSSATGYGGHPPTLEAERKSADTTAVPKSEQKLADTTGLFSSIVGTVMSWIPYPRF